MQFSGRVKRVLVRFDSFFLLPNWRFFSPEPRQADPLIVYRLRTVGERVLNWQVLDHGPDPAWSLFYSRRLHKAWLDIWVMLLQTAVKLGHERATSSAPYIVILKAVRDRVGTGVGFQFALVDVSTIDNNSVATMVYVSEPHPKPTSDAR